MSKKMMILALAVASAAIFALPAVASAESIHAEKDAIGGGSPGTFHGPVAAGSELRTTDGVRLHSTAAGTVHGEFETTTTGWLQITFHGVTGPFGFPCNSTSPAEPSGTVKTTKLTFHLLKSAGSNYVLITPSHAAAPANNFAHLSCAGIQRTVEGTGLLGTLTAPACGASSNSATVKFESSATAGHQKHTTITGVKYTFTSAGSPASMNATGTLNFNQLTKLNCT